MYQMRKNKKYIGDESKVKHIDEILMLMSAMTGFKNVEKIIKTVHERKINNMKGFFEIAKEQGIEKDLNRVEREV